MRDLVIALMLVGMVVILFLMWSMFPSMWIGNIIVTIAAVLWGFWLACFTDW